MRSQSTSSQRHFELADLRRFDQLRGAIPLK
jgi:hypothetical protein